VRGRVTAVEQARWCSKQVRNQAAVVGREDKLVPLLK
jgi:hypothetical protein